MGPRTAAAVGLLALGLAPIAFIPLAVVGLGAVAASTQCIAASPSVTHSIEEGGPSPFPAPTFCTSDGPTVGELVQSIAGSDSLVVADPRAAIAVRSALAAVSRGGRYVAEGNGPVDFDCSGLTAWVWHQAGVYLADYSYTQRTQTADIPRSAVAPGDLVFWFGGSEHHVAIVVAVSGSTITIAEAANPSAGLRVRDLGGGWDDAYLTGFGRVVR